jgi:hypothetical protein
MSKPKPKKPARTGPRSKGNIFQYAWDFTKNLMADNKFWSRFNGIPNGAIFVLQGAGIALALSASTVALQALSIAGGLALTGVGVFAIGYGFTKSWMSLEGICERSFPKFNPMRKLRTGLQKLLQKPLPKKILGILPFKKRRGMSERKQDVFLSAVTLEGASAAAVYFALHTAKHIAKTAMTVGKIFTPGMIGAAYLIGTCTFDVFCCARTLLQTFKSHRKEKKERKQLGTTTAPPVQEAKSETVFAEATAAFNNEAAPDKAAKAAASAPAASQAHKPTLV